MQENVVAIRDVCLMRKENCIFKDINLKFPKGKIVAVMGPSGAGKTSILRLIGGQLQPSEGDVHVFGQNINQLSQRELYAHRRRMGMLFQNAALFTHMSVFANVAFPLREHTNLSKEMIRDLVLIKLQAVGLRGAIKLKPSQLSGGMAKRVALARAIILDPELILYDEPFTGQDPITKGVLIKLIKTINQVLHSTTIVVSHNVSEVLDIADYVYIVGGRTIIGEGTPEQLLQDDSPQVKQFIHGLPDGVVPFHYPTDDFDTVLFGQET